MQAVFYVGPQVHVYVNRGSLSLSLSLRIFLVSYSIFVNIQSCPLVMPGLNQFSKSLVVEVKSVSVISFCPVRWLYPEVFL